MSEGAAERHKLYWLPNALTVSRIFLIPVLVWGILVSDYAFTGFSETWSLEPMKIAFAIFIFCVLTDFLDGYIARKLEISSDFGRMLDPIADKLLVAACLITFCITSNGDPLVVIPSLVIIGRDIFVSGIREHAANANLVLSPTKLAKWKTAYEMLGILLLMSSRLFLTEKIMPITTPQPFEDSNLPPVETLDLYLLKQSEALTNAGLLVIALAAILSAYTGFHYFRSAMKGKPTS